MAERFGLLGWPVKHSVSPQMQEAGFRAIGRDATYELIEVHPDELAEKVAQMKAEGFSGWNITVPHKTAMAELVDDITPAAKLARSINTVCNRNGKLFGYSTDGYGLEMSIKRSFGCRLPGNHFLFWGSGGAARATSIHFAEQGAGAITLVNRTLAKAEALAEDIRQAAPGCQVQVYSLGDLDLLKQALNDADIIIQSTSIGLHKGDPIAIPKDLLSSDMAIIDMIYRPTPLLAYAEELGCKVADGKEMLLYQGVKSFSIWTGIDNPPVEAMRQGLMEAIS